MTEAPATLRPATPADLPGVAAVYAEVVRTSVASFDLEPAPASAWEERLAATGPGLHLLVADRGGQVVGYAASSVWRPRPAYAGTRETSVHLAAEARGRGLGRLLYGALLDRLAADGVHTAVAVVALPNPASEALHRALGFEPAGRLREVGHKHDRWVDTALYQRLL